MKPVYTEKAFSTPWFDLVAKTMQPGDAPYYSLRLPDYAAIVAITEDQRILAVRQYRPALERFALELPSGLVDPGETPEAAARRELLEETGYRAEQMKSLPPMTVDNGRMNNRIWCFVALDVRQVQSAEPGIEVLALSMAELQTALANGEFDHALHIAGILQAITLDKLR